ncbi:Hint domain-containing protein [Tateyamaria omphalii]|uniref:Hint domain-containing protein n=1 Tax=Tateyamaria omphalii TaxID=299262 RepID=UPI001C996DC9|nr:Hint domain-containing protein [Tateyamaria omphalii]MBY5934180.1 Hint domain-containing protein [Tateyamaria omphalii]
MQTGACQRRTMGMDDMFGWKGARAPQRMPEMSAAWDGGVMTTRGLLAGTRVATAMGWRVVEALAVGDLVLTFDAGLQRLVELRRDTFWAAEATVPAAYHSVFVPAGALGNSADLELLPDQGVLVESDAACDAYGDPFAVLSAKSLEGFRGIRRMAPRTRIEVMTLVFAEEQVIYAEGGALVHCPPATRPIDALGVVGAGYDVLPARDAAFLVECMKVEDQTYACAA